MEVNKKKIDNENVKVGIIVPTRNRADFVIRLLNYYASLQSPHPIYLGDSSDHPETVRIKKRISELQGKLDIIYHYSPPGDVAKCEFELLKLVKENYTCLLCDDDFHVPSTLTLCAEFLEKNPEYASTIGLSVTFKIKNNGVYGKLAEVHDYLRRSIEAETASDRLLEFFGPDLVPLVNCVSRTKQLLHFYEETYPMKDMILGHDVLPSALVAIAGKYKVVDKLGFVRQLHDSHNPLPDMYDWVTGKDWQKNYAYARQKLIHALMEKDQLNEQEAEINFKKAFWNHFNIWLPKEYGLYLNTLKPKSQKKITFRTNIATTFPILKRLYRQIIRPLVTRKIQLHYEVTRPHSTYYNDFQAIVDALHPFKQ